MTFDVAAPQILDAVRTGASLDEAARRVGVPIGTVRGWAHRGRKNPSGKFAAFAEELDEAKRMQALNLDTGEDGRPMSRAEIEQRITAAIRNGSLQAMRLWLDLHRDDADGKPDALSQFLESGQ